MTVQTPPLQGKRVAFFHQSSDLYGSDRVLLDLADAVRQSGGEPLVLLPDEGLLTQECTARGIEWHAMPVLKLSRAKLTPLGLLGLAGEARRCLRAVDRALGTRRIDLVHSNTLAVLGGALWARRRGVAHLWHLHEMVEHPRPVAWAFPRLVHGLADRVVCNSYATRRWLLAAQPSLAARTEVVWNGVRPAREPTADDGSFVALRRRLRPDGAQLAVGLAGRINRLKGHHLLMDAMELLHDRGLRDASVAFVGSAPPGQEHFAAALERRIADSPVRSKAVMHDFVKDVGPVLAALDVVCVPSTEAESFGLVAVEAMAASRPVVASRLGGLTEVVADGVTGILFPPRDARALADALESLLRDNGLRAAMGQAARRRFEAEFSVTKMTERFVAIYIDAIRSSR